MHITHANNDSATAFYFFAHGLRCIMSAFSIYYLYCAICSAATHTASPAAKAENYCRRIGIQCTNQQTGQMHSGILYHNSTT